MVLSDSHHPLASDCLPTDDGKSDMDEISRVPLDLIKQTAGTHSQYPDGFMPYLGTTFSPIKDRGGEGKGFTHSLGGIVTISAPTLGALVNSVGRSDQLSPWTYGIRALVRNLASRWRLPLRLHSEFDGGKCPTNSIINLRITRV